MSYRTTEYPYWAKTWAIPFPICPAPRTPIFLIIASPLNTFKYHCHRFAAADTERGQPVTLLPLVQLANNRSCQPCAAGADRMTHCAGATVDVNLFQRQIEAFNGDKRHRSKCFVDFEKVDCINLQPCFGTDPLDGHNRSLREVVRVHAGCCVGNDPGFWLEPELFQPRISAEK